MHHCLPHRPQVMIMIMMMMMTTRRRRMAMMMMQFPPGGGGGGDTSFPPSLAPCSCLYQKTIQTFSIVLWCLYSSSWLKVLNPIVPTVRPNRLDMLPGLLSEDLCSLRGGVDRFAMSVIWTLDKDLEVA